jgi:hypothetical protein
MDTREVKVNANARQKKGGRLEKRSWNGRGKGRGRERRRGKVEVKRLSYGLRR